MKGVRIVYKGRCKHCFKTFHSKIRTGFCPECSKLDETVFDRIEEYLRKYPNSNALQISESLEIDLYSVIGFMNEGRLIRSMGKFSKLEE